MGWQVSDALTFPPTREPAPSACASVLILFGFSGSGLFENLFLRSAFCRDCGPPILGGSSEARENIETEGRAYASAKRPCRAPLGFGPHAVAPKLGRTRPSLGDGTSINNATPVLLP